MINPVPDEEGDRVCEKCGCIFPEKCNTGVSKIIVVLVVLFENIDNSDDRLTLKLGAENTRILHSLVGRGYKLWSFGSERRIK